MGATTHVTDEEGQVLNRYEYDARGNLTTCEETVPNRFKYTGQQFDPITRQYYLRARFYNPVVARFTQEDTYRSDGLNLYAYCHNNPVFYIDPSGNLTQCQKDAYDRYRQEGMTAAEAYQAATGNIGVRPEAMTDRQMQMAIDSIYMAGNPGHYNSRDVQALTITPDGRVVLSANGGVNRPDSVTGEVKTNASHAEARAAAHILGNNATTPVPAGVLSGTRQATSAYACNGCTIMQQSLGISNVTGTRAVEGQGRRIQRLFY